MYVDYLKNCTLNAAPPLIIHSNYSFLFLHTQATIMAARMTRMTRINTDFYHAFGGIGIRSATNYTNFHELNIHFVHVNALSRKRSLCLNS